jgi:lysyl-tRNA synthetase class II
MLTTQCITRLQAYADYITMLELTEELIRAAAQAATGSQQVSGSCHGHIGVAGWTWQQL